VATCPQDAQDINEIIELADRALYFSKESGKNKVSLWSEIPVSALIEKS
jgi:PleD family two-component response regulator